MIGSMTPGTFIAREDGLAQTIWKFPLGGRSSRVEVEMPDGAIVVEVAEQHGGFTLWAVVVPGSAPQRRVFYIVGTGDDVPADAHTHIGTVHTGGFVFHIFEGFK